MHQFTEAARLLPFSKSIHALKEKFPAYAPELNPAEYIWNQADSALSNTSPEGLDELEKILAASIRKTGASQKLLAACIKASELPWK